MLSWQRWKHRVVRDLAWVIASPPLASGEYDGVTWWDEVFVMQEYQACLSTLTALDKDPSHLIDYLAQQKGRALGHRFEAFIAYWIQISPNFELLHRSVQLHAEGRTLGELDFILRDTRTQQVIHLEVAVKFYMGLYPLDKPENWHGPNLKDSLAKKLNHLKAHQTQLSLNHSELIPETIDQRCCCVKGRLFYPMSERLIGGRQKPLKDVADNHLHGEWGCDVEYYKNHLSIHYPESTLVIIPIDKPYWFAECDLADSQLIAKQAKEVVEGSPQCFVIMTEAGEELARYFQFPLDYFDEVSSATVLFAH